MGSPRRRGDQFFLKIPGGGGGLQDGRVWQIGELGRVGLNMFFRGRNVHQD